jgi:5-methylcytosine-specific restriction enzyme B
VLYGPPGTGKTYQSREIAGSLIRQELLKLWGPRQFFTESAKVEGIASKHTQTVQFHPRYGYEDFVRGLPIGVDDQTEYRDGVLLRIVEEMKRPGEDPAIPLVLILDEMNRAEVGRASVGFEGSVRAATHLVVAGKDCSRIPVSTRDEDNPYGTFD